METDKKTQTDAEAWKSLLRQPRTSELFKVALQDIALAKALYFQYKADVISRRGETAWQESNDIKKACMNIAKVLTDKQDRHFGILLRGTNGNGKTTLANAFHKIVNSLAQMQYLGDCKGAINRTAKELVRSYGTRTYDNILDEPVIIIDDLGNETTETMDYGNVATPIVDMLEHRYNNQLFTLITTNLTADQIQAKYGLRIRDRLKEMAADILVKGTSYR